jgi:hypothetical protein
MFALTDELAQLTFLTGDIWNPRVNEPENAKALTVPDQVHFVNCRQAGSNPTTSQQKHPFNESAVDFGEPPGWLTNRELGSVLGSGYPVSEHNFEGCSYDPWPSLSTSG